MIKVDENFITYLSIYQKNILNEFKKEEKALNEIIDNHVPKIMKMAKSIKKEDITPRNITYAKKRKQMIDSRIGKYKFEKNDNELLKELLPPKLKPLEKLFDMFNEELKKINSISTLTNACMFF